MDRSILTPPSRARRASFKMSLRRREPVSCRSLANWPRMRRRWSGGGRGPQHFAVKRVGEVENEARTVQGGRDQFGLFQTAKHVVVGGTRHFGRSARFGERDSKKTSAHTIVELADAMPDQVDESGSSKGKLSKLSAGLGIDDLIQFDCTGQQHLDEQRVAAGEFEKTLGRQRCQASANDLFGHVAHRASIERTDHDLFEFASLAEVDDLARE